jgi:hypothetical protein
MFGRLFRGKSRAARLEARPAGRLASPYAPLFEEPLADPPAGAAQAPELPPIPSPGPIAQPPVVEVPVVEVPVAALEPPKPAPPAEPEPAAVVEEPPPEPVAEEATVAALVEEASPAPAAAPFSAEEHAAILGVMRVAPDVRYRAARSAGLLDGLEDVRGAALEHAILERARDAGKLSELAEATSR